MSSYIDGLKGAVRDAVCRVSGALDSAVNFTFGTPPGTVGGLLCNDPTPPPPIPPPFAGGQCSGVGYAVTVNADFYNGVPDCDTPSNFAPVRNVTGPVRGVRVVSNLGVDGPCDNAAGDTIILTASDSNGDPLDIVLRGDTSDVWANARIVNVVRLDGLPDDCGDPAPPPPPPIPPQPISFTYINNEGDNVDVSGDVNINAPILIAPFTLVAPITVNLGGITFGGGVEISPDFDVTISPSFGGGGGGPPEPIPPGEDDPDEDDPDEPTECEDAPIKGLVVDLSFTSEMRATEVRQDGSLSSLAVPRAAILYFIAVAGNRSVYMPGVDLKSRSQYVPVPYNTVATCWRIHTEPGVSVTSARPVFDIPTQ